ncbi:MAG: EAL domain-containing protein [Rhodoferax sp.]|nr:EAL domain-containing protein [Rhodoferax sp.]
MITLSRISDSSFGVRLFLIVLLLNSTLILFAFYSVMDSKQGYEERARLTTQNLTRMVDQSVAASVRKIDLMLLTVVDELEHEFRDHGHLDPSHANPFLIVNRERLSELSSVRVTDGQGLVILGDGVSASTQASWADRDFFSELRDHPDHGLVVTNPILGRVAKTWVISFVRRYNKPDGSFAGVVSASVPVTYLGKLLSAMDVGPKGITVLRDANLGMIARHPALDGPVGAIGARGASKELSDAIAAGQRDFSFHSRTSLDGVERTTSYRRMSSVPFSIVVGLGSEDYLAPWEDSVERVRGAVALFLLVTSASAWLLWRAQIKRRDLEATRDQALVRLQKIANRVPGMVYQYLLRPDGSSCLPFASDAIREIYRVSPQEVREDASKAFSNHHPDDYDGVVASIEQSARDLTPWVYEYRVKFDDGTVRCLLGNAVPDRQEDGAVLWHGFITDVTERNQIKRTLAESAESYRTLVEWTPEPIAVHRDGKLVYVNPAATAMFGATSAQELVGRPILELVHPEFRQIVLARVKEQGEKGMAVPMMEEKFLKIDGTPIDVEVQSRTIQYQGGVAFQVAMRDITSQKAAQERLQTLAFYDPLTGLPNRRLLMDRLQQDLAGSARHKRQGALLMLDLDNFKDINDVLGHEQGDLVLQKVAKRLSVCVRERDTLARVGADEFVVLLAELDENPLEAAMQAELVGHKILDALKQPYQFDDSEMSCTASIGITLFGEQHDDNVEALKRAEMAMYQAKAQGRNTLRFFDPKMQAVVASRVAMEASLREAIGKDQFVLHYQPQVTDKGQITGVEALLRWLDPKRGMVSPAEFIPVAEETGLILPIGNRVIEIACKQLAQWASQPGMAHLTVAVNVSARQFHQRDFVDRVLLTLERTGANPHRLKLELTESLLIEDVEGVIFKMNALMARGVTFSLDDFGTGYSSLSYLQRLPLNQLKIDQGFVRDILINPNDAAIAKMVVALADSLGLTVIPEGVETQAQRDFLLSLGCHHFQGYLFSRALPVQEFEAFLARC